MSWNDLPPNVQDTAARVLTPKQLVIWKLELAGYSIGRMSTALNVTRPVIKEQLVAVYRHIERAGIREDQDGWKIEDAA
jgi:hypothetical protein